MPAHTFGRCRSVDARDKKFQMRRTASSRKYRYWTDSRYWGDQLKTPHCVGFAWMHWLTNAPIVSYINPDGIYRLAKQNDEWDGVDYHGTSIRAGAKILKYLGLVEKYEWCWDLDRLVGAVLERGPVVLGTNWMAGMDKPDDKGVIRATGRVLGGHAYLITGVSCDREMFRIKNSWGRKWALNGRAWIPFADMETLIKAEGEVCLAVERLAKPPKP